MKKKKAAFWGEISISNVFLYSIVISCVLLVLDKKDIPSYFVNIHGIETVLIVISTILLIAVVVSMKRHLFSMAKIPCGNAIDEILLVILFADIIVFIFELIVNSLANYKFLVIITTAAISFLLLFTRILFCYYRKKHTIESNGNIVDLYDFLEGKRPIGTGPLMFSESESQKDLLGRKGLINLLYTSIVSSNSNSSFVIGVQGKWGSGKTTLLNLTKQMIRKNNPNVIVIDEFDPWVFGSQESLLVGLYDEILKKLGIGYNSFSSKSMVKKIQEAVTSKYEVTGIINDLVTTETNSVVAVKNLKNKIEVLLQQMNKSIVFFIDNIDRADSNNVIFLFKLIGTVFNLPNIVYVLAYDANRINNIFSDEALINPKYIEKIIQQEICIPEIESECAENLEFATLERVLSYYGVTEDEMKKYSTIAKTISQEVKELRQFKRLLNSAFATTFFYENDLYKPYLLAMETIRFMEPGLYESIRKNSIFFVSRDIYFHPGYLLIKKGIQKYNEEAKTYFDNLFERYPGYKTVLSEMFEYVKRYDHNQDLKIEGAYPSNDQKERKIASISSAKFFDLYFSYGENNYLRIVNQVDKFVSAVNRQSSESEIRRLTGETITSVEKEEQREWLERLQFKGEDVDFKKREAVALGICDSIGHIDEIRSFGYLSANQRALDVAISLLKGLDDAIVKNFIYTVSKKVNIRMLEKLVMDSDILANKESEQYKTIHNAALEQLEINCNRIIEGEINLYDDEHYEPKCIWVLYRFFKEDKPKLHAYISKIVNSKTVFRLIADIMQESTGTGGYGYTISKEYVSDLVGNQEVIDNVLKCATPHNESEKFVLSIWNRMVADIKDVWGENTYYSPTPIRIEL